MTELLTAAQMRAIEQAAIASGEVTGLELMERAGQGVVDAIFEEWPAFAPAMGDARGPAPGPPEVLKQNEEDPRRAVVLCGPGNNGGDGFVVARLLRGHGWAVEVYLYGNADKLPPDARVNYERWCELGEVKVLAINPPPLVDGSLVINDCDLIVDAFFGTGLKRPFKGVFAFLADQRDMRPNWVVPVVAIDVPSGLCADSGKTLGSVLRSDLTVTFQGQKVGHFVGVGPEKCGKVIKKDIGIASCLLSTDTVTFVSGGSQKLSKGAGHKYTHGHALILSGGVGKGGAARLAARGALRIGAGAVTLGCPPAALIENAAQLNAIMLQRIADANALTGLLTDTRLTALCLGPGLGCGDREVALVKEALQSSVGRGSPRLPFVLDADALTILSRHPDIFAKLHADCVLTPHAGEFKRLFPDIAAKLDAPAATGPAYSKVDATRDAAKRAGCIVLFKGPDTVIATPEGRCRINASVYDRAAPWLATAGAGDVLAGFITGLLTRGFDPLQAAETGAWLHTECALRFGPGLIAEDLPEQLPAVLKDLGA